MSSYCRDSSNQTNDHFDFPGGKTGRKIIESDRSDDSGGENTLTGIYERGQKTRFPTKDSKGVRGADIPAPVFTYVDLEKVLAYPKAGRNGANQITEKQYDRE